MDSENELELEVGAYGTDLPAAEVVGKVKRFKRCVLCEQDLTGLWLECSCGSQSHVDCLAHHFMEASHLHLTLHINLSLLKIERKCQC